MESLLKLYDTELQIYLFISVGEVIVASGDFFWLVDFVDFFCVCVVFLTPGNVGIDKCLAGNQKFF